MASARKDKAKSATTPAATTPEATTKATGGFPVVGIGASAGGLTAFEAFFSGMPVDTDPGMAFVLVQHLAPDHKSILTDLIQRCTRMPVFEVEDGMVVQPNCAYIIPPNRDMAFLNGTLQLLEPTAPRGHRLPIDFFFSSLARDQHERAIGIVLSGTGSDGTVGIRAIKGEGGMAMAQRPDSTEFDGMPRSAIDTGLVDYELAPADMAAQLVAYAAQAFNGTPHPLALPDLDQAMKKVFVLVRAHTGHDFSLYKPSTVRRRIERRMAVHQIDSIDSYAKFLGQTPAESEALFRDLLIGVTSFFRDPEAFTALETQVIPKLFEQKSAGDAVRVWCAACSTGEEAYSIAILLFEHMERLQQTFRVQVFATDIDSRAIAIGRSGLYAAGITRDLTPQRLSRFFTPDADGSCFRVNKNIRDMLVFSEQDLIKDPPFSKLDLVSCRNLLIYMGAELQKKLIPLFHYTLKPGGVMFLGTSETLGEFSELFSILDGRAKLFRRRPEFHGVQRAQLDRLLAPMLAIERAHARDDSRGGTHAKPSLRELTEQALLKQVAASALLVNGQGDILYQHGRTGLYLEPMPGEAGVSNILKMARDGLRHELTIALHDAIQQRQPVRLSGLRVRSNGHYSGLNLGIEPLPARANEGAESNLYLVLLEDAAVTTGENRLQLLRAPSAQALPEVDDDTLADDADFDRKDAAATIAALGEELRGNREYLEALNEELETSNEELKSSNEEMQSINEELQSSNEELETSKEEMQSINEELATVNAELQNKVVDLSRASNDMKNLLACTGIGTVFVDLQLHILRYTPMATRVINLIPSDVGRPMAHTVSNLVGYSALVADAQGVLDTLQPKEVEVQTAEGAWYTMRIQPYRTFDNVIEGAVITFVDISESVRARHSLRKANALLRLAVVVRDASDAITVQDLDGRILAWNPGAVRLYGWSEAEALAMNARERTPPNLQAQAAEQLQQMRRNELLPPGQTTRLAKDGRAIPVWLTVTALVDESGAVYAVATTERALEPIGPGAGGVQHDPV